MQAEQHIGHSDLQSAKRVFGFVRPYSWLYGLALFFYSGQNFLISYITSLLLGWLSEAMLSRSESAVYHSVFLYVALFAIIMICISWGVRQFTLCVEQIRRDLKVQLFRNFVQIGGELNDAHSGKGIAALNTEADQACQVFGNSLFNFLFCFLSVTLSAIALFWIDWRLGLTSFSIGLLALLIQYRFAGPLGLLSKEHLSANSEAVQKISGLISGGATIRAFNLQQNVEHGYTKDHSQLRLVSYREAAVIALQNIFSTLQNWLTLAGIFGLGGYLVATNRMPLAALMMAPTLSISIAYGMSQIGRAWAGMQAPIAACGRIMAILDRGDQLRTASLAQQRTLQSWDRDYTLRIDDLSFTYLGAEKETLKHIDLQIAPNQMYAFVGRSGSGKSTLLRAIIGLYQRADLPITLGNLRYAKTPPDAWRQNFAYVDQNCTLFDMTIAENIALGLPGCSREDILQAARQAGADGFISALPQGYDTPCGEKGAALSGGQKQRIAIARALVRRAPILVFDEATSALDSEAERQVMQTIASLRHNHTILICSHHLQQIADADNIIVLEDGRVAESGSHEELLHLNGVYAELLQQTKQEATA